MNFSVQLDTKDFDRMMRGLDRLETAAKREAAVLNRESAMKNRLMITDAILGGKFTYKPYTKRYEKHKQKKVGHLIFWLYHNALMGSISAYNAGGTDWAAGITPEAVNTRGRKNVKVEIYAARHEKTRPLFSRVRREFIAPGGEWNRLGNKALMRTIKHWGR